MIGFNITHSQEAEGLISFLARGVHVYSNSWGPNDDGKTTGGPHPLTMEAIKQGVTAVSQVQSSYI
ncbi:hypothetical protein Ciccas_012883 [Cichlidogyrus casuarinus]|uniref:Uncharacterized protein n=1 Tax=Cichlidogyrus casuarinus TaxID=1844966 RepID=A0ABD2PNI7_9PLAT